METRQLWRVPNPNCLLAMEHVMHYEKLENGSLLISATTKDEQAVINAIITAIEAYQKTSTPSSICAEKGIHY